MGFTRTDFAGMPTFTCQGRTSRVATAMAPTMAFSLPTGEGGEMLAAYVRILPPGVKYAEPSIGRVVTHPQLRRSGLGKQLMREAIRRLDSVAPLMAVRIGAQCYLQRFYEEFGFAVDSAPYDEDGILHLEMVRPGPD